MITITTFKWVIKLLLALVAFLVALLFIAAITNKEDQEKSDEQKKIDALIERQDKDVELDKED